MRKKLWLNLFFLMLITSACAAQTPAETVTPNLPAPQVATATPISTTATPASGTPTIPVTVTPTLGTPIPTNAPDCTNSAAFVSDVTVADNSTIPAGTTFTKTWRIRNTGTCIWGPDYTLVHYSEEILGAPASVPLSVTYPNQTVDISVNLRSGSITGTHRGNFVIKNPAGLIMKIDNDSRLWVMINVTSEVASASTETPAAGSIPVTGSGSGSGFAAVTCGYTTEATRVTDVITAVNAYRAQNNLPAYTVNDLLTKAAVAQANDMACNQLFSHIGSNSSTPASRVAASGYVASAVTENVYGSYPPLTGQVVVDWWKNDRTDPSHNQNLLSSTYTEIGVGYSFYDNFGYYVIVFAKP